MLVPHWEHHATAVANAGTDQELFEALEHVIEIESITSSANAVVLIGGDTRPHTEALVQAACEGVELSGARVHHIGTCTTPVLHYAVLRHNQPDLAPYGDRLVGAFKCLTEGALPCLLIILASSSHSFTPSTAKYVYVVCNEGSTWLPSAD